MVILAQGIAVESDGCRALVVENQIAVVVDQDEYTLGVAILILEHAWRELTLCQKFTESAVEITDVTVLPVQI
jgi:hypothetical protein